MAVVQGWLLKGVPLYCISLLTMITCTFISVSTGVVVAIVVVVAVIVIAVVVFLAVVIGFCCYFNSTKNTPKRVSDMNLESKVQFTCMKHQFTLWEFQGVQIFC